MCEGERVTHRDIEGGEGKREIERKKERESESESEREIERKSVCVWDR